MSIPQKILGKYLRRDIDHILRLDEKFNICITFDEVFVNNYMYVLPIHATIIRQYEL
jgi:hypothetical protein